MLGVFLTNFAIFANRERFFFTFLTFFNVVVAIIGGSVIMFFTNSALQTNELTRSFFLSCHKCPLISLLRRSIITQSSYDRIGEVDSI